MQYLPDVVEPRCKVCQSDLRMVIDQMSCAGYKPAFIAEEVQKTDPELSQQSIRRHLQRHVNYEQKALQEILHARAKQEGLLEDSVRNNILTRQAVLDIFVKRTYERVMHPEAKIPYEVGLKAIELQEILNEKQEANVIETLSRQMGAIIQAIREIVPMELHDPVARRAEQIFDQPVLRELTAGTVGTVADPE